MDERLLRGFNSIKVLGQVRFPISFIQEETWASPASLVSSYNVITQERDVCVCVCVLRRGLVGLYYSSAAAVIKSELFFTFPCWDSERLCVYILVSNAELKSSRCFGCQENWRSEVVTPKIIGCICVCVCVCGVCVCVCVCVCDCCKMIQIMFVKLTKVCRRRGSKERDKLEERWKRRWWAGN